MATATADPPKAEKKEKKETEYSAFRLVTGNADQIAEAIAGELGDKEGGVLIFIGKASTNAAPGPKSAMKLISEHHQLNGDYEIVAARGFTSFHGLATEMAPRVKGL